MLCPEDTDSTHSKTTETSKTSKSLFPPVSTTNTDSKPIAVGQKASTCQPMGGGQSRGPKQEPDYTVWLLEQLRTGGMLTTRCRYYGISVGIAVVALSYASVPLYKMVSSKSPEGHIPDGSLPWFRYANRPAGPANPSKPTTPRAIQPSD